MTLRIAIVESIDPTCVWIRGRPNLSWGNPEALGSLGSNRGNTTKRPITDPPRNWCRTKEMDSSSEPYPTGSLIAHISLLPPFPRWCIYARSSGILYAGSAAVQLFNPVCSGDVVIAAGCDRPSTKRPDKLRCSTSKRTQCTHLCLAIAPTHSSLRHKKNIGLFPIFVV